jgi:hypothetical protein
VPNLGSPSPIVTGPLTDPSVHVDALGSSTKLTNVGAGF